MAIRVLHGEEARAAAIKLRHPLKPVEVIVAVLGRVAASDLIAFANEAGPVAAAGIRDMGGRREVWLSCEPRAGRDALAILREGRRWLGGLTPSETGQSPLVAFVIEGHEPGRRLARLLGFRPGDREGAFETWCRE